MTGRSPTLCTLALAAFAGCPPHTTTPVAARHGRARPMELRCHAGARAVTLSSPGFELCGQHLAGATALVCKDAGDAIDGAVEVYAADRTLVDQGACSHGHAIGGWAHWAGERLESLDTFSDGVAAGMQVRGSTASYVLPGTPPSSVFACPTGTTESSTTSSLCAATQQCIVSPCTGVQVTTRPSATTRACEGSDHRAHGPVEIREADQRVLAQGVCWNGAAAGAWIEWIASHPVLLTTDGLWFGVADDGHVLAEGQRLRDEPVGFEWRLHDDGYHKLEVGP